LVSINIGKPCETPGFGSSFDIGFRERGSGRQT
jgi:hypothetical protein